MALTIVTVNHIHRGEQIVPYGDHIYEAVIKIQSNDHPKPLMAHDVERLAYVLVSPFSLEGEGTWADPRLDILDKLDSLGTKWRVRITRPFTD
ncbi:MAG: hypothetical protein JRH07_19280 [Deltaproteobacteria bacterium]|nr:hypothetical protein [Deltaproteobacteria bacterium]